MNLVVVGLLAFCALVWGSSFILMKKGLEAFPPDVVAALRLTVAGLCLAPMAVYFAHKRAWKLPWGRLGLASVTGNLIPAFLFPIAISNLNNSAVAGMLNASTPLFTILVGAALFQLQVGKRQLAGILAGLAGAVLLALLHDGGGVNAYAFLIFAATLFYAFNVNWVSAKLSDLHPLEIGSMTLTLCGIPAVLYLLAWRDLQSLVASSLDGYSSLWAVVALGAVGTALAQSLFFVLLRRTNVAVAGSVTYLMPAVATLWGFLDGEPVDGAHVAGLAAILAGVGLVQTEPRA